MMQMIFGHWITQIVHAAATFSFADHLPKGAKTAEYAETLQRTSSSWDGEEHKSYPPGQPELSILKITLAPHAQLEWHSHPMPSAAYIVAGELTIEIRNGGKKRQFTAGQAVSETVETRGKDLGA